MHERGTRTRHDATSTTIATADATSNAAAYADTDASNAGNPDLAKYAASDGRSTGRKHGNYARGDTRAASEHDGPAWSKQRDY